MHARPKGHMRVRIAGDVKRVYLWKHLGIPIRRSNEPPNAVILVQDFAAYLHVLGGDALDGLDWGIVPQALLGGLLGSSRRVIFEHFPLILMLDKRQGAIAQQIDGRLVTCQQQERRVYEHLMPREDPTLFAIRQHGNKIITRLDDALIHQRGDVVDHALHALDERLHTVSLAAPDVEEEFS